MALEKEEAEQGEKQGGGQEQQEQEQETRAQIHTGRNCKTHRNHVIV